MFRRSSSERGLSDPNELAIAAAAHVNSSGGGLFQGLRKKTLMRMSRSSSLSNSASLTYSSTATAETPSPGAERREVLDARTRYFLVLMKRFQEQDCSLRQLEAELDDMLAQFQVRRSSLLS